MDARVSNLKKGKATDQKVGVDCQDDIQRDCEEEMMGEVDSQGQIEVDSGSKNKSSRTSQSCRSLDGGDEEQEYVEERRQQGEKGSATWSAGGDSLQDASVRLIQVYSRPARIVSEGETSKLEVSNLIDLLEYLCIDRTLNLLKASCLVVFSKFCSGDVGARSCWTFFLAPGKSSDWSLGASFNKSERF